MRKKKEKEKEKEREREKKSERERKKAKKLIILGFPKHPKVHYFIWKKKFLSTSEPGSSFFYREI